MKAQETTRKYAKHYLETRASLEHARTESQRAPGRTEKALIESLEHQFNEAQQQLVKLCAGHHPSATEGHLAAQQSQANEQLEALQVECNALHEVATQAVTERDAAHRDVETFRTLNLRLRATLLGS